MIILIVFLLSSLILNDSGIYGYIQRKPRNKRNHGINIFPNQFKLCEKSYCLARNALCNDFSCCKCYCPLDNKKGGNVFFGNMCIPPKDVREKLNVNAQFLLKTKDKIDSIPMIQRTEDIEKLTFKIELNHSPENSIDKCFAGALFYFNLDRDKMVEYNENRCQEVLEVHTTNPMRLKWTSHFQPHWDGMYARMILIKVGCYSEGSRNLVNGSLIVQVAGTDSGGEVPDQSSFSSDNLNCEMDGLNSKRNNKESNIKAGHSQHLLIGVLIGLAVLFLMTLIGIAFAYKVWKKKKNTENIRKRPKTEENEYMEPAAIIHHTEDEGGYLLPSDCLVASPTSPNCPQQDDTKVNAELDSNGYVALADIKI